jgi:hypothetical protein
MHEQSETIQDEQTGRFQNVHGKDTPKAGQPLAPQHPFERADYGTAEEAAAAAALRSRHHNDGRPKTQRDLTSDEADFVSRYSAATQDRLADDIERKLRRLNEEADVAALKQGPTQAEAPATKPKAEKGVVQGVKEGMKEAVVQGAGGAWDAVVNGLGFIHDMGNWLRDNTPLKGDPIVSFGAKERTLSSLITGQPGNNVRPGLVNLPALPRVREAEDVPGALTRNIAQFMTGMVGFGKVMKHGNILQGAGRLPAALRSAAQGTAADSVVFDPHDGGVANLIEQLAPDVKIPLVQYLAVRDEDTRGEARFKRAIEGLGLGAAAEGVFLIAKGLRTGLRARKAGIPLEDPKASAAAPAGEAAGAKGAAGEAGAAVEGGETSGEKTARGLAESGAPADAGATTADAAAQLSDYAHIRQAAADALDNFTGVPGDPGLPRVEAARPPLEMGATAPGQALPANMMTVDRLLKGGLPDQVAGATGVPPKTLRDLVRDIGGTPPDEPGAAALRSDVPPTQPPKPSAEPLRYPKNSSEGIEGTPLPPADGMVRLYRGMEPGDTAGRFAAAEQDLAAQYAGSGRELHFVDVPAAEAEAMRVSNNPAHMPAGEVAQTGEPTREFFLRDQDVKRLQVFYGDAPEAFDPSTYASSKGVTYQGVGGDVIGGKDLRYYEFMHAPTEGNFGVSFADLPGGELTPEAFDAALDEHLVKWGMKSRGDQVTAARTAIESDLTGGFGQASGEADDLLSFLDEILLSPEAR